MVLDNNLLINPLWRFNKNIKNRGELYENFKKAYNTISTRIII